VSAAGPQTWIYGITPGMRIYPPDRGADADPDANARHNQSERSRRWADSGYDHRGSWAEADGRYVRTPDYGGLAVEREPGDPHVITVDRPAITRQDLQDAWRGLPSRSVSPADLLAVQDYRARLGAGETVSLYAGDPGSRLLDAECESPEAQAAELHDDDEQAAEYRREHCPDPGPGSAGRSPPVPGTADWPGTVHDGVAAAAAANGGAPRHPKTARRAGRPSRHGR
jgi:hypothetical protein